MLNENHGVFDLTTGEIVTEEVKQAMKKEEERRKMQQNILKSKRLEKRCIKTAH